MTIGLMPGDILTERAAVLTDPARVRQVLPGVQQEPSGSRGEIIGYDERTAPAARLTEIVERDEPEQAAYLRDLLDVDDAGGVDTAFVYTFASRHLPTSEHPERDFDLGSFGIVKVLPPGRTGSPIQECRGIPRPPSTPWPSMAAPGRGHSRSDASLDASRRRPTSPRVPRGRQTRTQCLVMAAGAMP
ncbi:hypothetical protein [Micromonospora sp. NPDC003776]